MTLQISGVLSNESIEWILSLPEVVNAKERINAKERGSEYFSISLSSTIKMRIFDRMGLDLSKISSVPMRWIKGDIPPHTDNGAGSFSRTYLTYLSDSYGKLVVDGNEYPISKGYGYIFNEGLSHETIGTNLSEPRLLLGPMSETGFSVGVVESGFYYPGGTTVYIRQTAVGGVISFSTDQLTWVNITSWPHLIGNNDTALGVVNVEFTTDITIDSNIGGQTGYFVCSSASIQFGARTLKHDGTRPIITIHEINNYDGFVQNGTNLLQGHSNVFIMNLEIRSTGGSHLVNGGGWFGQTYFGNGTVASNNVILNCRSTGDISNYSGGIVGQYAGPIKLSSCSSSGAISQFGGGIVGGNSPSTTGLLRCESCWSSGVIGHFGGGITGQTTGSAIISNCYSTGAITENAGGISGRYTGGSCVVSECYSTGAISDRGGGIVGSDTGVLTVSNCYSTGTIAIAAGGIIGTVPVENSTNKNISNCYTTGTTGHTHGYIVPEYTNVTTSFVIGSGTLTLTNNYSEAANASSGWKNSRANATLQGTPLLSSMVGTKWVYAGANTPYELLVMGYTPYTRTNVSSATPPAIVRSFSSSIVAGSSSSPGIINGNSYSILEKKNGEPSSYASITINSSTGAIMTTNYTIPGTYTLTIRNNGSYHITTYIITITEYRLRSFFGLFTNNAQVFYKPHSHASGGIGTVRNCRRKARKT